MCIHITDSLCYTAKTNTTLESNYIPTKINFKNKTHFRGARPEKNKAS